MNKKYAEYFRWKRINTLKNGDIIFWLILLKKLSYLYLFHVITTIFFNYLYYLFAVVWFRVIKLVTALLKLAPLLHTRAT